MRNGPSDDNTSNTAPGTTESSSRVDSANSYGGFDGRTQLQQSYPDSPSKGRSSVGAKFLRTASSNIPSLSTLTGSNSVSQKGSGSSSNSTRRNASSGGDGISVMRPHSTAYSAVGSAASFKSALSFFLAKHYRPIVATGAFVVFVLFVSSDLLHDLLGTGGSGSGLRGFRGGEQFYFGGAIQPGYFKVEDSQIDDHTFRFAAVTDLDQLSRLPNSDKLEFYSLLLPGILTRDPSSGQYSVKFDPTRKLISKHNEGGRGMELSELTIYDDRLLTFDDRTGTVYELLNKGRGRESYVVPRLVVTEGGGNTDKGMKWEWATVKGKELYMGSMGKEFTNPDGSVANTNNLWIATANQRGDIHRRDWSEHFNFVRAQLGASYPGYFINEAILWSDHLKRWVFLPRRISSTAYDENEDERRGSNKVALVDEGFTQATVVDIKLANVDPLHGFSTFAFVPGTRDKHALAIRTVEEDCVGGEEDRCKQRSYFTVFDVTSGDVLMDEVELPEPVKYEGVEFVNIYTPEPEDQPIE